MNISELAFKYKKLFLFIVVCLMIYGGLSYFTLPSQEDPTIVNREAIVSTNFPGMSPERIELLITKKLEEQISFLQNEVNQMSDEIFTQQKEILKLNNELINLKNKIDIIEANTENLNLDDDVSPPHY